MRSPTLMKKLKNASESQKIYILLIKGGIFISASHWLGKLRSHHEGHKRW